jgi:hypothetical protein
VVAARKIRKEDSGTWWDWEGREKDRIEGSGTLALTKQYMHTCRDPIKARKYRLSVPISPNQSPQARLNDL